MKITKTSLKRIIKEELTRVLKEYEGEGISGPSHVGSAEEVAKGHADEDAAVKFALEYQKDENALLSSIENEYDENVIKNKIGSAITMLELAHEVLENEEYGNVYDPADIPKESRPFYYAFKGIPGWIKQLQQWLN